MTQVAKQLRGAALQLSEADRAELACALIVSLEDDQDADAEVAWDAELDRRVQRLERGESQSRPAADVVREIRDKYQ